MMIKNIGRNNKIKRKTTIRETKVKKVIQALKTNNLNQANNSKTTLKGTNRKKLEHKKEQEWKTQRKKAHIQQEDGTQKTTQKLIATQNHNTQGQTQPAGQHEGNNIVT